MFTPDEILSIISTEFPTVMLDDGDLSEIDLPMVTITLGELDTRSVAGVIAIRALIANQTSSDITTDIGIGKFGLSIQDLVNTGYIKPQVLENIQSTTGPVTTPTVPLGIVSYMSQLDPTLALSAVNTPSSWTGQLNIYRINDLIGPGKDEIQQEIFQNVLTLSYNYLETNYPESLVKDPEVFTDDEDYQIYLAFLLSVASLGTAAVQSLANDYVDEIVSNYAVNTVQGSKKSSDPSSASLFIGAGAAAAALSLLGGAGGLTALFAKLNNFSLADIGSKPINISASTFLSRLTPSTSSIAGTLDSLANSAPSNPLSALSSALNSNPITSAVSGTTNRASLTASINNILIDPKDPNSAKLPIPSFAVPSVADAKQAESLLNSGLDTLKKQLGVGSLDSSANAALGSLRTIADSLRT